MLPDINEFIHQQILNRNNSFFQQDIDSNKAELQCEIENKKILVIGGGGTIGSNFIKALLPFNPSMVIVIDTNENGLTELVRDVRSTPQLPVPAIFITYPIDFGSSLFEKIYQEYKPFDIVANFAAHKHVRSEKDIFSVEAMIKNNLIKAKNLLELILLDKPSHFFCVSTDKAANPVNIMGATKKLMEDLIMSYSDRINCTTARFANVAFSNGSLLDGFVNRLLSRQPLSTPLDVKRYFVSPQESGHICMLACMLGKSGEIFFPAFDENKLVNFFEITKKFLAYCDYEMKLYNNEDDAKLASLVDIQNGQYPVYAFKSDTTGEKLYEEFFSISENPDLNRFKTLGVISNSKHKIKYAIDDLFQDILKLLDQHNLQKADLVNMFKKYIPEFTHLETGKSLDKKM